MLFDDAVAIRSRVAAESPRGRMDIASIEPPGTAQFGYGVAGPSFTLHRERGDLRGFGRNPVGQFGIGLDPDSRRLEWSDLVVIASRQEREHRRDEAFEVTGNREPHANRWNALRQGASSTNRWRNGKRGPTTEREGAWAGRRGTSESVGRRRHAVWWPPGARWAIACAWHGVVWHLVLPEALGIHAGYTGVGFMNVMLGWFGVSGGDRRVDWTTARPKL